MPREPALRNTFRCPGTSLPQRAFHPTDHVQQDIHPTDNPPPSAKKSGAGKTRRRVGRRRGRLPSSTRQSLRALVMQSSAPAPGLRNHQKHVEETLKGLSTQSDMLGKNFRRMQSLKAETEREHEIHKKVLENHTMVLNSNVAELGLLRNDRGTYDEALKNHKLAIEGTASEMAGFVKTNAQFQSSVHDSFQKHAPKQVVCKKLGTKPMQATAGKCKIAFVDLMLSKAMRCRRRYLLMQV
jgi:hypothetical protein